MDLIVKAYPPRPGGGVGDYLCNMNVGEMIHGTVKGKRIMHGSASVLNRWNNIGLIAGGTGIAPLLQVARIVLESQDIADTSTNVHLLFINCNEEDILARDEIEDLASKHSERFHVTYSLTSPTNNSDDPTSSWKGYIGRGDMAMIKTALPPSTNDGKTMILVCGTDGFVASWAGPVGRAPKNPDGSKGAKIQGPLLGLLKEAGYTAEEVFKY
jgi:cytochrome-b5 reductase